MNWIIPLLIITTIYVLISTIAIYLFARIFGVRVEQFSLFFSPFFSIFKKKVEETEYILGWLPLGGFVKMSGMELDNMENHFSMKVDEYGVERAVDFDPTTVPEEEQILPHYFMYAAPLKRVLILFSGSLSALILGISCYVYQHEISFPLTKILVILGALLFGLGALFLIGKTREKPHWSKQQNPLYFALTFFLYCGMCYLLLDLINDIVPFYHIFTDLYAGKYSIRDLWFTPYSFGQAMLFAAFFGVFFFIINLLPLTGANGLAVVDALHDFWTKEKMRGQVIEIFIGIVSFVILGIWIWFLVSVF